MEFIEPLKELKISSQSLSSFSSQKQLILAKKLFLQNCSICHIQNKNVILAEKNLLYENLETDGLLNINNFEAEIINGTNHMSFFQKINKHQKKILSSYFDLY